jgi:hypothetical protein
MLTKGMKVGPPAPGQLYHPYGLLVLTGSLVMLAHFTLGRRRRVFLGVVAFALGLSVVFAMFVPACGGNGGGGAGNPGTASGTYTLTVSGSVSVGSSSLTSNLSLTLQVN